MNAQQEQILRNHIRNKIQQKHNQILMEQRMVAIQEEKVRKVVRGILLKEASEVNFDSLSQSTGINILKKTMKKIAGILQDTYMSLSSSKEQRDSFRAHILRNIVDLFIRVDLLSDQNEAGEEEKQGELPVSPTEPVATKAETIQEEEKGKKDVKEELDVDVKDTDEDVDAAQPKDVSAEPAIPELPPEANLVDAEKNKGAPTSDKIKDKEFVKIPGQDPTGRNVSMETFPFIQKSIADDYSLLSLEKDKDEYKKYALANVKAYFDQAEQKLAASVSEPYSSEYEKVKQKYNQYEAPSEQQIAESATYFKVLSILTNGKQIL
jgi:hypothetical protein